MNVLAPVGTIVYTPKQQKAYRERKAFAERQRLFHKDCGNYYFMSADGFDISPAASARLIYLATFLDYNGNLQVTRRTAMRRADLADIMNLSRTETYNLWKEVGNRFVFEDEQHRLSMHRVLFCRGKLPQNDLRYQQFYMEPIRKLYDRTNAKQHKHLGYVFMMLPYVNVAFNALCHNPEEKDFSKVDFMSVDEFCQAIGHDKNNRSRLLRIYSHITFPVGHTYERFCSFVTDGGNLKHAKIFVNPRIFYRGNDIAAVQSSGRFYASKTDSQLIL